MSSEPTDSTNSDDTWKVILLVDCHEPHSNDILNSLKAAGGVNSERRQLKVYDYLWIARSSSQLAHEDGSTPRELVLGHGVERKTIPDLALSLDAGTGATGLCRFELQKLKMTTTAFHNKIYLVEGNTKDLPFVFRSQQRSIMLKRIGQALKLMKQEAYHVKKCPASTKQGYVANETIQFLQQHHGLVQRSEVPNGRLRYPVEHYMTFHEMNLAAAWVDLLALARKALKKGTLGVVTLTCILKTFPTRRSLHRVYARDTNEAVELLVQLRTPTNRRFMSKPNAALFLTTLFESSSRTTTAAAAAAAATTTLPRVAAAAAVHVTPPTKPKPAPRKRKRVVTSAVTGVAAAATACSGGGSARTAGARPKKPAAKVSKDPPKETTNTVTTADAAPIPAARKPAPNVARKRSSKEDTSPCQPKDDVCDLTGCDDDSNVVTPLDKQTVRRKKSPTDCNLMGAPTGAASNSVQRCLFPKEVVDLT